MTSSKRTTTTALQAMTTMMTGMSSTTSSRMPSRNQFRNKSHLCKLPIPSRCNSSNSRVSLRWINTNRLTAQINMTLVISKARMIKFHRCNQHPTSSATKLRIISINRKRSTKTHFSRITRAQAQRTTSLSIDMKKTSPWWILLNLFSAGALRQIYLRLRKSIARRSLTSSLMSSRIKSDSNHSSSKCKIPALLRR